MSKRPGKEKPLGSIIELPTGYKKVKTATGWKYLHHIVAEQKLGRPLEPGERVRLRVGADRGAPTAEDITVGVSAAKSEVQGIFKQVNELEQLLRDTRLDVQRLQRRVQLLESKQS